MKYNRALMLCLATAVAAAIIGCKGSDGTEQAEATLVGQWVAVDGYETWGCLCEQIDSVEYHYLAFSIDEDSITMVMQDKFSRKIPEPPYNVFSQTYAYSVDSGNVVTAHIQGTPDFTLFKIDELSADTLFLRAECSYGPDRGPGGKEYYTMKRK